MPTTFAPPGPLAPYPLASTTPAAPAPAAVVSPVPMIQFFDDDGTPLAGGLVMTYAAGSSTPMTTWKDASGATANTNPLTLDASGRAPIWIKAPAIKYVVSDKDGLMLYTVDNVQDQGLRLRGDLAAAGGAAVIGYQPPGGNIITINDALSVYLPDVGYTTLAAAVAAAAGYNKTLAVTQVWSLTSSADLSACQMWFVKGGMLTPGAGATITIQVPDAAPGMQIFNTSSPNSATVFKGAGDLYMDWWGADPLFGWDSTAPIQAALTAAAGGRILRGGAGVYKVTGALYPPAYTNWIGPRTDLQSGASLAGGCMLKWAGPSPATAYATGSAMVAVHGVNGTRLDGINLDGANTANLTGYMVDAEAGKTAQRNSYYGGLLQHFGNPASDVPGAAMSFGDNDIIGGEQVDGVTAENFTVSDAYIGVRIKNANFAYGRFAHFNMNGINMGFDIEYSGYHIVEQCAFGTMQGTNPSVILINGPHGPVTYRHIQAENDQSVTGNAKMFTVNTAYEAFIILIEQATFGFPSVIAGGGAHLILIGNAYGGSPPVTFTLSGDNILVDAIESVPPAQVVITGVNSNWHNLSRTDGRLLIQTFETNFNVPGGSVVEFRVRPGATAVTEASNLFTDVTGQQWQEIWSASQWGIRDKTASGFLGLSIAAGLSGSDGIAIKPGSTTINGVTYTSQTHGIRYFSTQGGVNNAITVTTPDGVWQPAAGDMISIALQYNSMAGGGVQCTVAINGTSYLVWSSRAPGPFETTYPVDGLITLVLDRTGTLRTIGQ